MKSNDTIAIFGSAFNPPHLGHADVITQALEVADHVFAVPSYKHAFGKTMMSFSFRVSLVENMISDLAFENRCHISTIEETLSQSMPEQKPIYTFDVLEAFEKNHPDATLIFVVGPDNAEPSTWNKFYKAKEIQARWQLWQAEERLMVRSTPLREKLKKNILPSRSECSPSVIKQLAAELEQLNNN